MPHETAEQFHEADITTVVGLAFDRVRWLARRGKISIGDAAEAVQSIAAVEDLASLGRRTLDGEIIKRPVGEPHPKWLTQSGIGPVKPSGGTFPAKWPPPAAKKSGFSTPERPHTPPPPPKKS